MLLSTITDMSNETKRGKRKDPNYGQLVGDIPKEIIQTFKINCVKRNLTIGQALTEAVDQWNQTQEIKE